MAPLAKPTVLPVPERADATQRFAPRGVDPHHPRIGRGILVGAVALAAIALVIFAVDSLFLASPLQASGQVQAVTTAQLNTQTTGPLTAVRAQVGQVVHGGALLASMDSTSAADQLSSDQGKLASDQAKLASDQANLAQLKAGPLPTTVQQLQAEVDTAQTNLSAAQLKLTQTQATATAENNEAAQKVQSDQGQLSADQQTYETNLPLCTGPTPPSYCLADQRQVQVDQAQLQNDLSAQSATATEQQALVSAAQSGVDQAEAALAQAQANQAAGTAAATAAQLSAAEAAVAQDQAAVQADQAQIATDRYNLGQTDVRAPARGGPWIVASVNGAVGTIATPDGVRLATSPQPVDNQTPSSGIQIFPQEPSASSSADQSGGTAPLITLYSLQRQIVVQVPETAISQVHVGEHATATFPAVPGYTAPVVVHQIQPAPVEVAGATYYLVVLDWQPGHSLSSKLPSNGPRTSLQGITADVSF